MRAFVLSLIVFPCLVFAAKIPYSVEFIGLDDKEALKTLKSVSDLSSLKERPPASINALRYRAESDIPELLKVLHAHGYYEATVDIRIEEQDDDVTAFVMIQPGAVYKIDEYVLNLYCGSHENRVACEQINLESIGIKIAAPALAKTILDGELKALTLLSECGYPLASIEDRKMVADGKTKTFHVTIDIQTGPFSKFGPTTVTGTKSVKPLFIERKTEWKEGDCHSSLKVEKTEQNLMDSGLFSSSLITHAENQDDQGRLPMRIEVNESKHKSLNVGVSYQTFFGPGITFGWENRNVGGMGRKLSLQGDATRKTHAGSATYLVPDCWKIDQDYVAQAIAMHESIFTYSDKSYSLTNRIEWRINTEYRVSMGAKIERLLVKESVDNGDFTLLEVPLYFRFSSANHLLNPTKGATLEYKAIPSSNFSSLDRYYLYQKLAHAVYWSVIESHAITLAQQIIVESILSKDLSSVPVPKRVLGGTDQELRGYRYKTVSPLGEHHKPRGGQSGIFYTFEARFRLSKSIGLVPFFDLGSVYMTRLPNFHGKWFKSAGLGFRYFTFLGPLRFDIAFPLDRRRPIDPLYRVLVSLGQTF